MNRRIPNSLTAIIDHHRRTGHDAFSNETLTHFQTRLSKTVYSGPGGIYLITTDRITQDAPRRHTVHEYDPTTGAITVMGTFSTLTRIQATYRATRYAARGTTTQKGPTP